MKTQGLLFELDTLAAPPINQEFVGEVQAIYKRHKKTLVGKPITDNLIAAEVFRKIWANDMGLRERVYALFLNSANDLIGYSEISSGGVNYAGFDHRLLFQKALLSNCVSFIISHNHPSQKLIASPADIKATKQLQAAGRLLCIELVDHLILTDADFCTVPFPKRRIMKRGKAKSIRTRKK